MFWIWENYFIDIFIEPHKELNYFQEDKKVTEIEKTQLPRTIKIFRSTNFNNLKVCNMERETDTCMKLVMILVIYLFTNN